MKGSHHGNQFAVCNHDFMTVLQDFWNEDKKFSGFSVDFVCEKLLEAKVNISVQSEYLGDVKGLQAVRASFSMRAGL